MAGLVLNWQYIQTMFVVIMCGALQHIIQAGLVISADNMLKYGGGVELVVVVVAVALVVRSTMMVTCTTSSHSSWIRIVYMDVCVTSGFCAGCGIPKFAA